MKTRLRDHILYQYAITYGALLLIPVLIIIGMSVNALKSNQKELTDFSE